MSSPASFKGHPLDPVLVAFPIGLWIFLIISDLIFKFGYGGPVWNDVAFYTLAGGIVGALVAGLFGKAIGRQFAEAGFRDREGRAVAGRFEPEFDPRGWFV